MTPLGLARKISTAFRLLGFGTGIGHYRGTSSTPGEHYVRVYKSRRGDNHLGNVTIHERLPGELIAYVEHDSDPELHDAFRALTSRD